jgi:hypothetical protein
MKAHWLVFGLCMLSLFGQSPCHGGDSYVVTPSAGPNGAIYPATPPNG